jgi:hypothetical protein
MVTKQANWHTSKQTKTSKRKANGKRQIKKAIFFCKFCFRSGGEENERQMANNVNARDEFAIGTW